MIIDPAKYMANSVHTLGEEGYKCRKFPQVPTTQISMEIVDPSNRGVAWKKVAFQKQTNIRSLLDLKGLITVRTKSALDLISAIRRDIGYLHRQTRDERQTHTVRHQSERKTRIPHFPKMYPYVQDLRCCRGKKSTPWGCFACSWLMYATLRHGRGYNPKKDFKVTSG
jgi:hypothetical protein